MSRSHTVLSDGLPLARDAKARLYALAEAHHDFVWRTLRRLGVSGADTDDATQQVFLVALRRLDSIDANKERSFLYGVAVRVARAHWRTNRRRGEEPLPTPPLAGSAAAPDRVATERQALRRLEAILNELSPPLREVLVLVEIEELSTPEVAELLSIPRGTVCSRLRRARTAFRAAVEHHTETEP